MSEAYPKRESHFAHKFVRVLMRSCAAQDIGPEACYMLVQIAHTEDAARYRRGVRFFNDQLIHVAGVANLKALQRARDRAVEAGWLHYEAGARNRPAIYWVTIPDWANDVDDGPMDEGDEPTASHDRPTEYSVENDSVSVHSSSTIRPQSVHNPSTVCPTIYPIPSPIPNTHTQARAEPAPLRTWKIPPGCSEPLTEAIDQWQRYRLATKGRPQDDISLEMTLANKRSAGWDESKIVQSIRKSIEWQANSWRDPDADHDEATKAKRNGHGGANGRRKVKFEDVEM